MEIAGKVVLITGASGGIGLATARLFARHGARVALAARSADKLRRIAADLPDALAIPTDMRDEAAVRAMVAAVERHDGRLDVLVNNAGQGMHTRVETADPQLYRALFELNVVGVLVAMQAAIPLMRRQGGGVIVNISSGTTKSILPGTAPYASTKHALNGLTLAARAELAAENIRVGLVYPWITATDFAANRAATESRGDDRLRTIQGDTADDVAELILEAVETEAAEVYAANVKRMVESGGTAPGDRLPSR